MSLTTEGCLIWVLFVWRSTPDPLRCWITVEQGLNPAPLPPCWYYYFKHLANILFKPSLFSTTMARWASLTLPDQLANGYPSGSSFWISEVLYQWAYTHYATEHSRTDLQPMVIETCKKSAIAFFGVFEMPNGFPMGSTCTLIVFKHPILCGVWLAQPMSGLLEICLNGMGARLLWPQTGSQAAYEKDNSRIVCYF